MWKSSLFVSVGEYFLYGRERERQREKYIFGLWVLERVWLMEMRESIVWETEGDYLWKGEKILGQVQKDSLF